MARLKDIDLVFNSVFGEYFTAQRLKKGWSLDEASKRIGMVVATYYCYEQGTRSVPLSAFRKFCELYDLNYYDTFRLLGEMVDMRTYNK